MLQVFEIEKKTHRTCTLKKVLALPGVASFAFGGSRRALALQVVRSMNFQNVMMTGVIEKLQRGPLARPKVRYGIPARKTIWRF